MLERISAAETREGAGHLGDDTLYGDRHRLVVVEDVPDGVLGNGDGGRRIGQQLVGFELFHRSLQLADVVFQPVGDVFRHLVGNLNIQQLGLAADDGDPGLKIRGLHVGQKAPFKAGAQPLFQGFDLLGRPVGGQDNLFFLRV